MNNLKVEVKTLKEEDYIIKLDGVLNDTTVSIFMNELKPILLNKKDNLKIDCKDLQYIDSKGLKLVENLSRYYNKQLYLMNTKNHIKNIFKMTRLSTMCKVC